MIQRNTRAIVRDPLRDRNMRLKSLLFLAVKMQKTSHGIKKSSCNGKPKAKPAGKTVASGICLIKFIVHLRQLRIRHSDTGIIDIYDQIDPIILFPVINTDVKPALFRKLNGILHQDLKDMRYLFRISDKNRRNLRVDIEYQFQLMDIALHRRHGDHIIEYRRDHILFPCRRQRTFYDLRIIHHIVDLVRQPSARRLDRLYIRPEFRRDLFS